MALLNPITRTSINTNLERRYNNSTRLGGDIGTAKLVGTSRATTNMINGTAWSMKDRGNDIHSINFNAGGRVPGFTSAAFAYSRDVLRHSNAQYYG
jgi:hypothetical protein